MIIFPEKLIKSRKIVSFNEATVRAESSIPKLKRAAEEAGGSLQERVEKAQSLRGGIDTWSVEVDPKVARY